MPFVAASPDGILDDVDDESLVEVKIKCPASA